MCHYVWLLFLANPWLLKKSGLVKEGSREGVLFIFLVFWSTGPGNGKVLMSGPALRTTEILTDLVPYFFLKSCECLFWSSLGFWSLKDVCSLSLGRIWCCSEYVSLYFLTGLFSALDLGWRKRVIRGVTDYPCVSFKHHTVSIKGWLCFQSLPADLWDTCFLLQSLQCVFMKRFSLSRQLQLTAVWLGFFSGFLVWLGFFSGFFQPPSLCPVSLQSLLAHLQCGRCFNLLLCPSASLWTQQFILCQVRSYGSANWCAVSHQNFHCLHFFAFSGLTICWSFNLMLWSSLLA